VQFSSKPARIAFSTHSSFKIGITPGKPRSNFETQQLAAGFVLKTKLSALENNFFLLAILE
jgi:hypothetical protein